MVKNSTLFFFYDNRNLNNELLTEEELVEPEGLFRDELNDIFSGIEFSPSDSVINKILSEV